MPKQKKEEPSRYYVQALARGLSVIEAFADTRRLTLSDVAKRAGVARATARRLLLTLCDLGYAATDGKNFSLRPRALRLGYAYLSSLGWSDVALPQLRDLADAFGETCSVSVLDGEDIVYVARVPARRYGIMSAPVGGRLPAYATSNGRVMLGGVPAPEFEAYLKRVVMRRLTKHTIHTVPALRKAVEAARKQGYTFTDEELDDGVNSIAVPIRDGNGCIVAALNLSGPSSRVRRREAVARMLPSLREAARNIEAAIRGLPEGLSSR